ncbi:unnamed protein product [Effrenium voratum]|nr:unnamed protein product [Effrenium voratum]
MSSRSWHGQHAQLLESDDERSSWGSMPGRVVCPAAAVLMLLGTALVVAPQRMKTIRGSAVGYSADYADQAPQIMLLQFNPHWECFKGPNMEQCGNAVYGMVTRLLNQYQVDFANIVELPPTYKCLLFSGMIGVRPLHISACSARLCRMPVRLLSLHIFRLTGVGRIALLRPPEGWAMNCRPGGGGETSCALAGTCHSMTAV